MLYLNYYIFIYFLSYFDVVAFFLMYIHSFGKQTFPLQEATFSSNIVISIIHSMFTTWNLS